MSCLAAPTSAHVSAAITCKYDQQDSQKLTSSMCEVRVIHT